MSNPLAQSNTRPQLSVKIAGAGWAFGFATASPPAIYKGPMGARGLGEAPQNSRRRGIDILLWRNSRGGLCILPGTSGYEFLTAEFEKRWNLEKTQSMVQNALIYSIYQLRRRNIQPSVCYIREGPYVTPVFRKSAP